MGIALGNATDNIINIDSTGGVTIGSVISGASKKLTLGGAGTGALTLSGVNNYTGDTTINSGKLSLGTTGSIANSANIVLAGGSTFDVSTRGGVTLGSTQGLKGSGTTSTGTITTAASNSLTLGASSPLQFTAFNGTTAPLTVGGAGTLTLASGNPVTVNTTAALGAGDYTLIAKSGSATVVGTVPTSLTIGGSGLASGMSASLQITGAQLVLHVAAAGSLQFASATYSVSEGGGSVSVDVTRTGGTAGAVSINYTTGGGTATAGSDYTTTSGTLNWTNGDSANKTIVIPIIQDPDTEGDEDFNVTLNTPTGGATLGTPNQANVVINDDDLTFNASGTLGAGTHDNIIINNGAVVTLTGNQVVTGKVTINNGGTLDCKTFLVSGSGSFTLKSDGVLGIGSPDGISSGVALSGNIRLLGGRSYDTDASYFYDGIANQTVGNGLPSTVANLTIVNTGGTGNKTVTGNTGQAVTQLLRVQSGIYSSASDYQDVQIDSGATLSLAGNITVAGNWLNNGTFNANGFAVTFNGSANQTIGGTSPTAFATLNVSDTGGSFVTLSQDISDTALNVTGGTFSQGETSSITTGNVTVGSGGTWRAVGTGDITLSGNVSNSGSVIINANGTPCGDADDVLIRSSVNNTQRTWSGTGTFSIMDVNVKDQAGTAPIVVQSGTNSGNNGPNWIYAVCTSADYVWNGTTLGDWNVATNWTPTRLAPATNDVLIIDGAQTPAPTIMNVPTQNIAFLSILNGAQPVLQTNAANTLTISGSTGEDLSVPAGSLLTLSGSNALRINIANGTSGALVGGQIIVQGGAHRLIGNAAGAVKFQTGALFTTAAGFTGNAFGAGGGDGVADSVIFQSGSAYFHNTGLSPFGNSANPAVTVFQTGSEADFLTATGFEANGRTYANLVIGNSTTQVNASDSGAGDFKFDNLTVNSTASNNSSLTYTGSLLSTVTIQGNITSTGTGNGTNVSDVSLAAGTGGIILNKAGTQTFSNSAGSRTITFNSGATVNSGTTLNLSRNLIVTPSASVLTVNGALNGGPSGYVIGKLRRPINGAGTYTFQIGTANGYTPVVNQVTSVTGTPVFTASTANAFMSGITDTTKAIQRNWTLTTTAPAGNLVGNLTFQYLDSDLGTANEATLDVFRRNSDNSINQIPATSRDASGNTVTVNGINAFSDWTLANSLAAPTAVNMRGLSAMQSPEGSVLVQWQTGREVSNLGFVVYREMNGRRTRITPSMVAGSALMAGANTTLTAGQSYTWFDQLPARHGFVQYWVEDVDLNGTRTMHGPIVPSVNAEGRFSRNSRALMLNELQAIRSTDETAPPAEQGRPAALSAEVERAGSSATTIGVVRDGGCDSCEGRDPADQQRELAAGQAVKLSVRKSGWYRVTRSELIAAGLPANAQPDMLRLFVDGIEQPIVVNSTDSQTLSEDATIEFYGTGLDQPGSDAHTYWLIAGAQSGKRIIMSEGEGRSIFPPGRGGGGTTVARNFDYTIERRDRVVYFSALHNGDADNFFGPIISTSPATQTLNVRQLDAATGSTARLEVALQGGTMQAHQVSVRLNGHDVGTVSFSNEEHPVMSFNVSPALLTEGQNTITLTALGGDTDISVIDYVNLTYSHKYAADNDALTFYTVGGASTAITGFTSPNVHVYNISDPENIQSVGASVTQAGASYTVTIPASSQRGQGRSLVAVADTGKQQVAAATANEASTLTGNQAGADLVIITHRNFKAAVEPLAQLRRGQGMDVTVVDVEDIYDEFSFGVHDTMAVKEFLQWTQEHWTKAPHYALFVGDASLDPRNYLGYGNQDYVPTKIVDSLYLETASDDALADFDNDGLAEISVGRLPVRTVEQAQLMVGKIVNYVPGQYSQGALLVADRNDGYDFEGASNTVRSLLPGNMPVNVINRGNNSDQQVKTQIINGLNQGPMIVNYVGHGSVEVWTGSGVMSSSDAGSLTNGNHLPVVVTMTCLNGYFHDVYTESLAEALMKSGNGGAVAVWSSSGLTEPAPQAAMNQQLMQLLFNGQPMALGDAVRGAKATTTDKDIRQTWILFGDPTMKIR